MEAKLPVRRAGPIAQQRRKARERLQFTVDLELGALRDEHCQVEQLGRVPRHGRAMIVIAPRRVKAFHAANLCFSRSKTDVRRPDPGFRLALPARAPWAPAGPLPRGGT